MVDIKNTVLKLNEMAAINAAAAADGDGAAIDYTKKDDGKILLLIGGANGKAVIKKGDMIQGVRDMEIDVTTAEKAIVVESGRFMNRDGKVVVSGLSGVTVRAVELP
ncbi:MAG: hypothetical protein E7235_05620 [Lachnospiraceae bacterium]|nr:hypothetical protein [Lachnospiraceae bacterium]